MPALRRSPWHFLPDLTDDDAIVRAGNQLHQIRPSELDRRTKGISDRAPEQATAYAFLEG